MVLIFILIRVLFHFLILILILFIYFFRFCAFLGILEGAPGFLGGGPGFLGVFRVFWGVFLVFGGCSGMFQCSGVPVFLEVLHVVFCILLTLRALGTFKRAC